MNSQEQDQQRLQVAAMGLLHALARAAGGTLSIKIEDIPEKLPFSFRVAEGRAIFVALENPPAHSSIIKPSNVTKMNRLNGP